MALFLCVLPLSGAVVALNKHFLLPALLLVQINNAMELASGEEMNFGSIQVLCHRIGVPFLILYPPYTAMVGLNKAAVVAQSNAYCKLNKHLCPDLSPPQELRKVFDPDDCCADVFDCYFCFTGYASTVEVIIMFLQFFVYMTLTLIKQYGIFNINTFGCSVYKPKPQRYNDAEVEKEKLYVNEQFGKPKESITDTLLLEKLHKYYSSFWHKPNLAVNDISWSVKKGECFGLLGVNGAGKTTTFNMITGNHHPTHGRLFCNGYFFKKWFNSKYMMSLGYCPQFFELDPFLTGKNNLELLLTLQGLDQADVVHEAQRWIEIVGLEKHKDKLQNSYSGGCARRLSVAAALSSGAPLVLLDEPTSGVDVSARRRVWVAMRHGLKQQQSIIITSHSMDEMEALCDRIAILSAGEVAALGPPATLRAHYASGHTIVFKINLHSFENEENRQAAVDELKQTIQQKFNCELKDEHQTTLKYHINETMSYSPLFDALEDIRARFPQLVEDYSATETTLEEVFLSFAHTDVSQEEKTVKKSGKKASTKKADVKKEDAEKADAKKVDAKKAGAKKTGTKKADAKKADAKKTGAKETDTEEADANKTDTEKADANKKDAKKSDADKKDAKKSDADKKDAKKKKKK